MKTQARFEIRTLIKGRIILNISGSQSYHELCQVHRTSAVFKMLVFMWLKNFQDRFTNHKDGSLPGQPDTVVISANIAAVTGLIK